MHGERGAYVNNHTAAEVFLVFRGGWLGVVVGDLAAVHFENTAIIDVHAALRSRDLAAIHLKCTLSAFALHIKAHTALHTRDGTAVHVESTTRVTVRERIPDFHAEGEIVFRLERALALSITVAKVQCLVLIHCDESKVLSPLIQSCRERIAVQAEVHIAGDQDGLVDRDTLGQIVVARREYVVYGFQATITTSCTNSISVAIQHSILTGQRRPGHIGVLLAAGVRAGLAADGMLVRQAVVEVDDIGG